MNEVELRIIGVSDLLRPSTSHALILEEVFGYEEKRRLALIIGDREAADIRLCMHNYDTPPSYDFRFDEFYNNRSRYDSRKGCNL